MFSHPEASPTSLTLDRETGTLDARRISITRFHLAFDDGHWSNGKL
jgi:hypothetical protein